MSFLTLRVDAKTDDQQMELRDSSTGEDWRYGNGCFELQLYKRDAAPYTYATGGTDGFTAGYKCSDSWREFLEIEYDSGSNKLTITRDGLAALPLFYGVSGAKLVVSNQYHEVATQLDQLDIDKPTLYEGLLLHDIGRHTIFRQIRVLMADEQLQWHDGQVTVEQIHQRCTDDAPDPKQFIGYLENTIETYLYEYSVSQVAVEASGGVDSSAVALVAHRLGAEPTTYSAEFSQEFQHSQLEKLQILWEHTGGSGLVAPLNMTDDYPLARFSGDQRSAPFYPFEDIYTEILDNIAIMAEEAGVTTIFTGVGGDELFESQTVEEELSEGATDKQRRLARQVPGFYTDEFKTELQQSIQRRSDSVNSALPRAARSAMFAHVSTNNVFIERGIWPVAPLADYELFAYTQQLPAIHKANKNILRVYLESIKAPQLLYNAPQNEHFGPILEQAMTGPLQPLLLKQAETSKLISDGLVNQHQLMRGLNDSQSLRRDAISYFVWLTSEYNLAAAE